MSTPVLPEYVAPYKPVPQVTPFTYRDGVTMLKKLDGLKNYINKVLVPFVNDNYSDLADAFETQVNILIQQVNEAIDSVINDSIEIQDSAVAAMLNNPASETRNAADNLFAAKVDFEALEAIVNGLATIINDGRLSEIALESAFMPIDAIIQVPQGGTGLTEVQPYRVVLSGTDTDGPLTLSGVGSPGMFLASGGGTMPPTFATLPEVINDSASSASTNRTYSANKITELLATKAAPNLRGTYAARPAASSVADGTIYAASDSAEQYMAMGGAWHVVGSGGNELAYAQITSSITTTSTSPVAIPGFTTTFTVGERPISIEMGTNMSNSIANNVTVARVYLDGVQIFELSTAGIDAGRGNTVVKSGRRSGLAPGSSHTLTVQWLTGLAATATMNASATDPAYVKVVTL